MKNPGYQVGDVLWTHDTKGCYAPGGHLHLCVCVTAVRSGGFTGHVMAVGSGWKVCKPNQQYSFGYTDWNKMGTMDPSAPD